MTIIAMLGSGQVGGALALRLADVGHEVWLTLRDPSSESARQLVSQQSAMHAASISQAVEQAEVIFLATPFSVAEEVIRPLNLDGKIIVDCTNPVGPGLTHGLESKLSGAEAIAKAALGARVVKAFTVYGVENLRDSSYPNYGELLPAMPIAGDDQEAKHIVSDLCQQLGFEPIDCGPLSMSLHLEHQTLLWVHMARIQGQGTDLVWGRLRR